MNKDNKIELEIREVEKRVAHENQCLVKLRALRMHKVLRREPVEDVEFQMATHDFAREQFVAKLTALRDHLARSSRPSHAGKPQPHSRFRRAEAAKEGKQDS